MTHPLEYPVGAQVQLAPQEFAKLAASFRLEKALGYVLVSR